MRGPYATLSKIDNGNGFGRGKIMPTRLRTRMGSAPFAQIDVPSSNASPWMRHSGFRSLIRLNTRSREVLPHPDGPINVVIELAGTDKLISLRACLGPYQTLSFFVSSLAIR